jgi:hypothetical protein
MLKGKIASNALNRHLTTTINFLWPLDFCDDYKLCEFDLELLAKPLIVLNIVKCTFMRSGRTPTPTLLFNDASTM